MVKKLALVFDTEADFYYKIPSPNFSFFDMVKWRINHFIGKLYRYPWPSRLGLRNIVRFLKKNKVKASFCICGHLYLKKPLDKKAIEKISPKNNWYYNKIGRNWYYWNSGKSKNSSFCLGGFIEKEMKSELLELGLHGFAHEALTLESKEKVNEIIAEGMSAAKNLGIAPKIFAAPFNMIEDLTESDKVFSVLRKNGIKYAQYTGRDKGLKNLHGKQKIKLIEKREGISLIRADGFIEGTHSRKKIKLLLNKIKDSNQPSFLIVSHDFTWKNTKNLSLLTDFCRKNDIKIVKMSELA